MDFRKFNKAGNHITKSSVPTGKTKNLVMRLSAGNIKMNTNLAQFIPISPSLIYRFHKDICVNEGVCMRSPPA